MFLSNEYNSMKMMSQNIFCNYILIKIKDTWTYNTTTCWYVCRMMSYAVWITVSKPRHSILDLIRALASDALKLSSSQCMLSAEERFPCNIPSQEQLIFRDCWCSGFQPHCPNLGNSVGPSMFYSSTRDDIEDPMKRPSQDWDPGLLDLWLAEREVTVVLY